MTSSYPVFTWLTTIIFLTSVWSCNGQPQNSAVEYEKLDLTFAESPIPLNDVNAKVVTDMHYKEYDNTVFDIYMPDSDQATPLVIYIHGGGFVNGEKERAYTYHEEDIPMFLEQGIAFATIGYRFIHDVDNGVMDCMLDSKYFIQYIRHHAASFNIDPERIASFGQSAGAGTSLWIGLNDDMAEDADDPILSQSTRLSAIGALRTQATYDILRWEEVFESYTIDMSRIPPFMMDQLVQFYGIDDSSLLDTERMIAYRESVDMLELMTDDDPPIFIMNDGKDGPPLLTDPQHHPLHAKILGEYADKIGIKNELVAPELGIEGSGKSIVDFFSKALLIQS